jgi:hypothetical protein
MPTRTQAIERFLKSATHPDLANLYTYDMECQVNVAQDSGERVEGDYKGRRWHGWTDGMTTWKSFRIPWKANTEPEYTDSDMSFDITAHAEGIGMTGWDWVKRVSKWVGFDFDAITGHAQGLSDTELTEIKESVTKIPWVQIRKSTSGSGLHLYVFLDDVPTANHNEHAALARAVLGMLAALTGYDFQSKVDICGGNMWVWHRKMKGTDGLELIKSSIKLDKVPPNWRDHVKVVSGSRRKNLPQDISEPDLFEELAGQRPKVTLDDEHQKVIQYLTEHDCYWWWDQDHHMLVTHTFHLKQAFDSLNLKGFFDTNSIGTNLNEQNCFAFPLRRGAWGVRRYTIGVQEHESWQQDGQGWTRTYLNREPDLATACRAKGGLEDTDGGFVFQHASTIIGVAKLLGATVEINEAIKQRQAKVKEHKDGRLIIEIDKVVHDRTEDMKGWLPKKNNWIKMYQVQSTPGTEQEVGNYDDVTRHLVTESDEDYGWLIKSDNIWRREPLVHVKVALKSTGLAAKEVDAIVGSAIFKCWKVVNKPFQAEYPGDREWNRNAAQIKYTATQNTDDLIYPTWAAIVQHCGEGLDDAVLHDPWCKANGLKTGADYLKCWLASLFQEPTEPLPYLFLYGPQNSGKSILHEALSLLLTKGYKRADAALISQSGFNAELEGAIVCVIEETDLNKNRSAYNRIKDWVTSKELLIHPKGRTPYHIPNTTHWIQCANDHNFCPIKLGDTRITMVFVNAIDPLDLIPKKQILLRLQKEAPDFLAEILRIELPPSNDRLNIPVIVTQEKTSAEMASMTPLENFIQHMCVPSPGLRIKYGAFYDEFAQWADPSDLGDWTKTKVGRELPPEHPKGRCTKTGQFFIGNIWWKNRPPEEPQEKRFVLSKGMLVVAK